MWIYEHKNWQKFKWDNELLALKLADTRYQQGFLLGRLKGLGVDPKLKASLDILTEDVVKSSAIEGEKLNPEEVRSSIARKLGMDADESIPTNRDVEGIAEITVDATQQYAEPLTKERLFGWHAALFPTGRSGLHQITTGDWRKEGMQVVSGPRDNPIVDFEAPEARQVEKEMRAFLTWFNKDQKIDPVLKAGIAHLWFVTIHPFEDGNGRIGRAIGDMALARADGIKERFYSMSAQIAHERKHYYNALKTQQRGTPDITGWLEWFLGCLGRAISSAGVGLDSVFLEKEIWGILNQKSVNDRQRLIINRMLEDDFKGYMNTSKYAKLAECSSDSALRDINDLKSREIFIQNPGGGRSTSYRLPSRKEIEAL